ncbi:hypothetical protein [Elizabethkingia miricola]|uniref:Uncharacterized protein n=1 Tax=Elizabethkingia miricola TaxID=172045 RepID=A0ABD5B9V4_ELIMR|nr:hypothetical protein [Elizabethkingia miricola]MDQ8750649.1 hypothetical protein [Elizabethkingia miricola]OPB90860.1 hypothetical protein BAS06_11220 [Elizabethkingia miricola]
MFSLAEPIIGEHHDLYNIEATLEEIISLLNDANIEHKSLFLNADSEFKSKAFGDMLNQKKLLQILKLTSVAETRTMKIF